MPLSPAPPVAPASPLAGYYQQLYQPRPLPPPGQALPASARVAGVPAISYANAYCQTASLQMLDRDPARAALDIHDYNWLTGFTYGAYFGHDLASFLPYNDPEICFQPAVRELGLARHYYATSDLAAFGQGLRQLLASQQPVRVALNGNVLLGRPGFFPHAVVVVGYEGDDIIYHETGVQDRYLPSHPGERTTLATLAAAAAQLQVAFGYPWRYNLTVLAPAPAASTGPSAAGRNARSLAGQHTPWASTGAQALRALAQYLGSQPVPAAAWLPVRFRFAAGVYTRRDNAAFLRRQPVPGRDLNPAADLLDASAGHFAAIVAALAGTSHPLPATSGRLPAASGQAPDPSGQAPDPSGQAPSASGQAPDPSGQAPSASGPLPGASRPLPGLNQRLPDTSHLLPGTSPVLPGPGHRLAATVADHLLAAADLEDQAARLLLA